MASAKSLRVNMAQVASFGATAPTTTPTAATTGWNFIPVLDFPMPTLEQMADEAQEANTRGTRALDYATAKAAGYGFSTRVHTGAAGFDGSGSDTDPAHAFMQKALESFFGAAAVTIAGTTLAASSTTAIPILTAFTNLAVGHGLMFAATSTGTANNVDVRHVTLLSAGSATVDQAIADATTGNLVYGGFQFVPTLGAVAAHHYLVVERDQSGHLWLLGPGRFTGLKVSGASARQGLRYDWQFTADTWTSTLSGGNSPSTALTEGGFTGSVTRNVFTGAPLVGVGANIGVDGALVRIASATIDFGVEHQEITATGDSTVNTAVNGRAGWEIVGLGCSGEFEEYYASGRWTQYTGRTGFPLRFVFMTGATNAAKARGGLSVWVPNAQIIVEEGALNGQVSQKVKWVARDPTTTQITNGVTKPFYVTVFGGNAT